MSFANSTGLGFNKNHQSPPGGLSWNQATDLMRALVESGRRIVGFDLCEVSPGPQGQGAWDANVGARLLYKLIGFSLLSRRSTLASSPRAS